MLKVERKKENMFSNLITQYRIYFDFCFFLFVEVWTLAGGAKMYVPYTPPKPESLSELPTRKGMRLMSPTLLLASFGHGTLWDGSGIQDYFVPGSLMMQQKLVID